MLNRLLLAWTCLFEHGAFVGWVKTLQKRTYKTVERDAFPEIGKIFIPSVLFKFAIQM